MARARSASADGGGDGQARAPRRGRSDGCAGGRAGRDARRLADLDRARPGARRSAPYYSRAMARPNDGRRGHPRRRAASSTARASSNPSASRVAPRQKRFAEVASDVLGRRMEQDGRIVVLGEDVHRLGGGTNGVTKRAIRSAPDRVLGTPISENAFAGLGLGMALDGRFRPVVEFMYPDFLWVAADQVFNQIGKARHMFGGHANVPLVLRTKVALGSGYGSQHSMDPAGIFATSPGWRIVAPSTARRLHRPDEHRPRTRGSRAGHRARRPLRQTGGRP